MSSIIIKSKYDMQILLCFGMSFFAAFCSSVLSGIGGHVNVMHVRLKINKNANWFCDSPPRVVNQSAERWSTYKKGCPVVCAWLCLWLSGISSHAEVNRAWRVKLAIPLPAMKRIYSEHNLSVVPIKATHRVPVNRILNLRPLVW